MHLGEAVSLAPSDLGNNVRQDQRRLESVSYLTELSSFIPFTSTAAASEGHMNKNKQQTAQPFKNGSLISIPYFLQATTQGKDRHKNI